MRHKLLVLTVKNFLQSVYIYRSYRKINYWGTVFLDRPVRDHVPTCVKNIPERHRPTDRQTGGQTSYCGINALCASSRSKNTQRILS